MDATGAAVANTTVNMSANYAYLTRTQASKTNDEGIAEFEIDRPIVRSSAWVANKDGIGFLKIEGIPKRWKHFD